LRFEGLLYRALTPRWQRQPLSGEGARRHGGRFNPRGMPALYTSLDPIGAIREAQQAGPLQPVTLVAYRAELDPVLDGTDPVQLAAYDTTRADLAQDGWRERARGRGGAPTQRLGERLAADGYVALLVPSYAPAAAPGDRNLVVFRWSAAAPTRLEVIDDEGRLG
jgi:RES domain-containing protein